MLKTDIRLSGDQCAGYQGIRLSGHQGAGYQDTRISGQMFFLIT